jgi:predicted MFS family arabinose efflux permease
MASSIWGIASILGPTLGGVVVTYFSWRWIFWINIPLGIASYWGISTYLRDTQRTVQGEVSLDFGGAATLTTSILAFLVAFLLGGRSYPWSSAPIIGLLALSLVSGFAFVIIEGRVRSPILSTGFFRRRGFSTGNGAVFLCSFTIFALFAFAPLFIQGVQGKSPMEVGIAMLSMSLGWSLGSLILGFFINRLGLRSAAVIGSLGITAGCAMALTFTAQSSILYSFSCFFIIGLGMGFVSLATLMAVQASVEGKDLGVATSSNQFARTLGGTVGVGVCGGLMSARIGGLTHRIEQAGILDRLPPDLAETGLGAIENMLRPEIQALMPPELNTLVHQAVTQGIQAVFWAVTVSAVLCVVVCLFIPRKGY